MNVSRIPSCSAIYAPRRVTRDGYRSLATRPDRGVDCYCPSDDCGTVDQTAVTEGPILPPWKVLPWPHAYAPARVPAAIKAVPVRVDVSSVGRTLDLFV